MLVDWRAPYLALKDGNPILFDRIMDSEHPACRRFARWLCHELLPAMDPFGYRGPAGRGVYTWPGTQAEFDDMIAAAVNAVRQ